MQICGHGENVELLVGITTDEVLGLVADTEDFENSHRAGGVICLENASKLASHQKRKKQETRLVTFLHELGKDMGAFCICPTRIRGDCTIA
jgi:hypothetical protein